MKKLLYALYILVALIVLIPKKELYFYVEEQLSKEGIYLSGESLSGGLFTLDAENVSILSGASKLAQIGSIRMVPWIVVNEIELDTLRAAEGFDLVLPGQIDKASCRYALWNPFDVTIEIDGDFGHAQGTYDLGKQKLILYFDVVQQMRKYPLLISKLRPEGGKLVYERTF